MIYNKFVLSFSDYPEADGELRKKWKEKDRKIPVL